MFVGYILFQTCSCFREGLDKEHAVCHDVPEVLNLVSFIRVHNTWVVSLAEPLCKQIGVELVAHVTKLIVKGVFVYQIVASFESSSFSTGSYHMYQSFL